MEFTMTIALNKTKTKTKKEYCNQFLTFLFLNC